MPSPKYIPPSTNFVESHMAQHHALLARAKAAVVTHHAASSASHPDNHRHKHLTLYSTQQQWEIDHSNSQLLYRLETAAAKIDNHLSVAHRYAARNGEANSQLHTQARQRQIDEENARLNKRIKVIRGNAGTYDTLNIARSYDEHRQWVELRKPKKQRRYQPHVKPLETQPKKATHTITDTKPERRTSITALRSARRDEHPEDEEKTADGKNANDEEESKHEIVEEKKEESDKSSRDTVMLDESWGPKSTLSSSTIQTTPSSSLTKTSPIISTNESSQKTTVRNSRKSTMSTLSVSQETATRHKSRSASLSPTPTNKHDSHVNARASLLHPSQGKHSVQFDLPHHHHDHQPSVQFQPSPADSPYSPRTLASQKRFSQLILDNDTGLINGTISPYHLSPLPSPKPNWEYYTHTTISNELVDLRICEKLQSDDEKHHLLFHAFFKSAPAAVSLINNGIINNTTTNWTNATMSGYEMILPFDRFLSEYLNKKYAIPTDVNPAKDSAKINTGIHNATNGSSNQTVTPARNNTTNNNNTNNNNNNNNNKTINNNNNTTTTTARSNIGLSQWHDLHERDFIIKDLIHRLYFVTQQSFIQIALENGKSIKQISNEQIEEDRLYRRLEDRHHTTTTHHNDERNGVEHHRMSSTVKDHYTTAAAITAALDPDDDDDSDMTLRLCINLDPNFVAGKTKHVHSRYNHRRVLKLRQQEKASKTNNNNSNNNINNNNKKKKQQTTTSIVITAANGINRSNSNGTTTITTTSTNNNNNNNNKIFTDKSGAILTFPIVERQVNDRMSMIEFPRLQQSALNFEHRLRQLSTIDTVTALTSGIVRLPQLMAN